MHKIRVIAAREYQAAVRTKSFLVSLILMPLLMCGAVVVQTITKRLEDAGEKRFAIVDRTPGQALFPVIQAAAEQRNREEIFDRNGKQDEPVFTVERIAPSPDTPEAIDRQRYELSQQIHHNEFYGFLEIGPDVFIPTPTSPRSTATEPGQTPNDRAVLRYQSNNPTYGAFHRWVERVVNQEVERQRCLRSGVPPEQIAAIVQRVPLLPKGLSQMNAEGKIEDPRTESQAAHFLMPAGLIMLMFLLIMVGATPLMQGVVEEKMQRIAEVLLGSVRPFELMLGKLFGMIGVSLTIAALYLAGAYWAAYRYGFAEYLPASLLLWFIVYQVLAVLMYGSLFIAIGAACTDMKETQSLLMPVMMLACLPLFVLLPVIESPNGTFATAISFVPSATPMLMVSRLAVPPGIAWWQPFTGVAVVLLATALCVYAAGRIFRVGILMQGKGANFGQLIKWVVRG
ncbi:MAG TPA: ABC transporter permease [Gemmataceae bacterium]|nr:ABC transporter permease [Gemmataceae bacterium]